MRSQQSIILTNRICGRFFVFLALLSFVLGCVHFCTGRPGLAAMALPGVLFFGSIGWLVLAGTTRIFPLTGDAGMEGAGKPVPVRPAPTHHLAAAKDLPPSEKTHFLPKD
jgi:hypothetical protein